MEFSSFGTFLPAGDLWTRLQRNFARLEEEKYYPANVFQRERQHEKWPGDTEGRTLLAWVLLAQATGRAPRYLNEVLERWPEEVNARGYFGRIYEDGISEQQLSSHGWVLRALAELGRWRADRKSQAQELALPIIENLFLPTSGKYASYPITPGERPALGEHAGTHFKQMGDWLLSTDVGCFAIGMDGLIDAFAVFGDDRLPPIIHEMVERFLAIDVVGIEAQTHATLTGLRGLIQWAELTGRNELVSEAEKRYALYTSHAWTEHYGNFNWFNRPRWTEPCAIVDSLVVAMQLWRHTRKNEYLRDAQLIWFNGLGHGQRANGGFGCDNCPGADGSDDLSFSTYESHWCCSMRGGEGLARMSQYQVLRDEETLYFPFLLPGDFDFGDVRGTIESGYPKAAEGSIHVRTAGAIRKLAIFVPDWMDGFHAGNQQPTNGWVVLPVNGEARFTFSGSMPVSEEPLRESTVRFLSGASGMGLAEGRFVYRQGPLLLAARPGADGATPDPKDLVPIFQGYLDGITRKEDSSRRVLFRKVG